MKKLLFAAVIFCFTGTIYAQKLEWVYTTTGGSSQTLAVTTDRMGNVYATGYFSGQVTFIPGTPPVRLTAQGKDIFVTKFNAQGQLLWVAQMGGPQDEEGKAIAVDSAGNVYTTGSFSGKADFNPHPVDSAMHSSNGGTDIFVSKLDSGGHYIWAKHFGSGNADEGYGIAVNEQGKIYTTGYFSNTVDFNPDGVAAPLTTAGSHDVFICRMNADGDYIWAGQMGGVGEDQARALVLDDTGNIYITGHFRLGNFDPPADYDPDPANTAPLQSNGNYDVFVCKLHPDGRYIWAKNMGGPGAGRSYGDYGRSIAVDKSGNVYTTGYFQGTADFNPDAGTDTLTASGIRDVFVSKLNANGEFVWAEKIGGDQSAAGYSITLDDSANVLLTGSFEGIVDFNPGSDTSNLISIGNEDIFICKWDTDARYKWAVRMGSTGSGINRNDVGNAIAVDKQGNVYSAGGFYDVVDFDPGPGTVNRYASGSGINMFVHKMGYCVPTAATRTIDSICGSISLNGTVYTQSGTYTQVLQNGCGLDSVLTLILTIYSPSDTFVANDGETLTAAQAEAYQWIDCWNGNLPIDGATGRSFTPKNDGNYAVILTGPGGCRDTSRCRAFVKGVGINALSLPASAIRAYPNPFTGSVQITASHPLDHAAVRMVSMTGQCVLEKNGISGRYCSIDTEGLPPGIYFLEITETDTITRLKLIKE